MKNDEKFIQKCAVNTLFIVELVHLSANFRPFPFLSYILYCISVYYISNICLKPTQRVVSFVDCLKRFTSLNLGICKTNQFLNQSHHCKIQSVCLQSNWIATAYLQKSNNGWCSWPLGWIQNRKIGFRQLYILPNPQDHWDRTWEN